MRWLPLVLISACSACSSSDSKPPPPTKTDPAPSPKPPDEMDERMRHCPLALEGATSTLEEIAGGVRFVVRPPAAEMAEARRRARHIVDFAAKKTREGHGGFDGRGGGRMKNCPVVTDDVQIEVLEVDDGVQLDVTSPSGAVQQLRAETRERAARFPFAGATIRVVDPA